MPLHPVSDYLDLTKTQAAGLFDGVGEVWMALPRIAPWLAAHLQPGNDGEVRGQAFVGKEVRIGRGTIIYPGAVIAGPAWIGENCFIGPGCYLRENVIMGNHVIAGNSCEFKNCLVFDRVEAPHWNYVGDSLLGYKCHLGAGRPSTQKWPDATTGTYTYDSAGRLYSLARSAGSGTWYYDYLDNDLPVYLTLPNGIIGEYSYDSAMRLNNLLWWDANYSSALNAHYYEWNNANEITLHAQDNGLTGDRTYTHDGISRLKSSTPSGTLFSGESARTWNYDANGNRTSVVTGGATVTYSPKAGEWNLYDTVGGLTQTYDANKNLTSDGVLAMTYDADNRLTNLNKSGAFTQGLVYDWMGRLIKKTVTPQGGSAATTRYYYSGWTVLAEVNESGGATLHRYTHGPGIDNLLTDETGGTTYYALQDLLGSTSALANSGTTVAQRYTYDAYGTPTVRNPAGSPVSSAPLTNYLYTGREYDPLSGLYNYRNRFYHPGLGRFLQPDPIGFSGGANLSAYVSNNPLIFFDPYGLEDQKPPYNGVVDNCSTKAVVIYDADHGCFRTLEPGKTTEYDQSPGGSDKKADWDFYQLPNGKWYKIGAGTLSINGDDATPTTISAAMQANNRYCTADENKANDKAYQEWCDKRKAAQEARKRALTPKKAQ